MRSAARSLLESWRAFGSVFVNADLRRIELAWAGSNIGTWAYGVALAVFAYQADGAYAVGLVGLIRFLVAGAVAPLTGVLGDRYRRAGVMAFSDLSRAAAITGMALAAMSDGPPAVVYGLSVFVTAASTAFRPAQAALLPSLARTPQQLTAANVASSSIESVGIFVGPALGGLLLAATNVSVVFLATAGLFLWSALLVARLPEGAARETGDEEAGGTLREALGGITTIAADSRLRLLVGLFAAQTFVDGALSVLVVVVALDLLDLGASGVGFLNSASGVGGLIGAVLAAALVGRSRLASDLGLGMVLWGLPILLIGLWPNAAVALLMLAVVGVGNTVVDVAGDTMLQRTVPDHVLARVFGIFESLMLAAVAVGAIAAPVLVDLAGSRTALVAIGALLPLLTLLSWRQLAAIDAAARVPTRELELLRSIPIFAPLAAPTLEALASHLSRHALRAGETVFRQGEHGDAFYVIAEGRVDVSVDGQPRRPLGPGEFFGEIALLRDVPRTATVTAATDAELFGLERDEFVAAVTGHPESAEAAGAVVGARLATPRLGIASA